MTASQEIGKGLRTFAADVAQGFNAIIHNGFALVGLVVLFAILALTARPELRQAGELQLFGWPKTGSLGLLAE